MTIHYRMDFLLWITFVLVGTNVLAQYDWPQWGGPQRDFRTPSQRLAENWPEDGPRVIWSRELAGGYSGIAVAQTRLFTLIRRDNQEIALCLNPHSGKTLWSDEVNVAEIDLDYGMGPYSTPLVDDDHVFFLGATGILRAHRCSDGHKIWQLDLESAFPGSRGGRGYACSPLLVDNKLIIPVGAPRAAVVALDSDNGNLVWKQHNFGADYASPMVMRVDGTNQLICHFEEEVVGLEPTTGDLLWEIESRTEKTRHVISPLALDDGDLLVSTTYSVQRITPTENRVEELWESRRIQAQVGNLLYVPDQRMILGASSSHVGSQLVAIDATTGDLLWRDRAIDCGFLWTVGDRLLALTSDGALIQADATRDGLSVRTEHQVFDDRKVWSAPAMRGTTIYLKDQQRLLALDLGS